MKKIICFAATCLAMAACSKNDTVPVKPAPSGKMITLSASIAAPVTRMSPDDPTEEEVNFKWEEGDSIYILNRRHREMRIFRMVDGTISEDGKRADFIGEELSEGMSKYYVYSGNRGSTLEKVKGAQTIEYINDSFKPFAYGEGSEGSFRIYGFHPVLKLRLKGDATVGSIRYSIDGEENVILSCGEAGLQLTPDNTLSVYLPLYTTSNAGFTLTFLDLSGDTLKSQNSSKDLTSGEFDNKIITCPELEIKKVPSTDLNVNGTANCYIVSVHGKYKFKATKGNSTEVISGIDSVVVLWESFGTSVRPEKRDIIKTVSYRGDSVFFNTNSTFREGNAVIAAKGNGNTILWSWHIWCTDPPAEQEYNNNAGTMMDRNLGATSATPGDVGALGLMYQWGRKDPFLGSLAKDNSNPAVSTLSWPSPEFTSYHLTDGNTLAYSISHPTTFLKNESTPYDWYCTDATYKNDTLWNVSSGKTIYDPCPVGYRVPKGGGSGIWAKAGIPSKYTFDSANKGMDFATYTTSSICWYPAAGFRNNGGSLVNVGSYAYYWSCTTNSKYGLCLYFFSTGVYTMYDGNRARGASVRCLKIK